MSLAAPPSSAKPEMMIRVFFTPALAHSSTRGGDAGGGDRDQREIDRPADGGDRGKARQAVDLLVARVDRQDAAGKAVLAQLMQQAAADAVQVGRGAEDRDRFAARRNYAGDGS